MRSIFLSINEGNLNKRVLHLLHILYKYFPWALNKSTKYEDCLKLKLALYKTLIIRLRKQLWINVRSSCLKTIGRLHITYKSCLINISYKTFWCVVSLSIFTCCAVIWIALRARQNITGYLYSIHALFVLYFVLCDNNNTYYTKQFCCATINCSENRFVCRSSSLLFTISRSE